MVGKPASVTVDEKGKFLSHSKAAAYRRYSCFRLPVSKTKRPGSRAICLNSPQISRQIHFLRKATPGRDSTSAMVSHFTIYAVNTRTTTITYSTTNLAGNLNSRVNGVMLVDNGSGIILKRSTQSVTTGYELVKGVIYTATQRTATSEVCYKTTDTAK